VRGSREVLEEGTRMPSFIMVEGFEILDVEVWIGTDYDVVILPFELTIYNSSIVFPIVARRSATGKQGRWPMKIGIHFMIALGIWE
jgi:hypothetical protein